MDTREMLQLPEISEIPDFGLYMDQVITYMEKSYPKKPLTKTMINNYSKDKILYPSFKKKYTREHLMLLALIQILKRTLTLPEIKMILGPVSKECANGHTENLYRLYEDFHGFFDTTLTRSEELQNRVSENLSESRVKILVYSLISAYFGNLSEELLAEAQE